MSRLVTRLNTRALSGRGEDKGRTITLFGADYRKGSSSLKMSSLTRSGCFTPLIVTNPGRDR